jgi:hypothetical protein
MADFGHASAFSRHSTVVDFVAVGTSRIFPKKTYLIFHSHFLVAHSAG